MTKLFAVIAMAAMVVSAGAQVREMSPTRARRVLLRYLKSPDTNLDTNDVNTNPVIGTSMRGHTEYMFYSDNYHKYRIDAATGDIAIDYGGQSTAYNDLSSATSLPVSQLSGL